MKRLSLVLVLLVSSLPTFLSSRTVSAGPPKAGDFTYVSSRLRIDGNGSDGLVDVSCPAGTRTTGVGGSIRKGNGNNAWFNKITGLDLSSDADLDQDDGARIEVWNAGARPRTFTAFAVCSGGIDSPDQTYNTSLQTVTSGTSGTFGPVGCVGGAAEEVLGGGGGVDNNPYDRLSVKYPFATGVTVGIRGNNPDDRNLQKTAICLPVAKRDITIAEKVVSVRPDEIKGAKAMCPRGTHVTGGGGYGGGLFTLLRSRPIDGADGDKVPDDGWSVRARNTHTGKGDFSVHAVCAGPAL